MKHLCKSGSDHCHIFTVYPIKLVGTIFIYFTVNFMLFFTWYDNVLSFLIVESYFSKYKFTNLNCVHSTNSLNFMFDNSDENIYENEIFANTCNHLIGNLSVLYLFLHVYFS